MISASPGSLLYPSRPHVFSHRDNCNQSITSKAITTPQPTHKSHFNTHRPCPIPPVRSITSTHSTSNLAAIASFENPAITLSRPRLPISAFTPSRNTLSSTGPHCSPARRNPVRLSSIVSRGPPLGTASTGVPCNCASSGTIPKCSFVGV